MGIVDRAVHGLVYVVCFVLLGDVMHKLRGASVLINTPPCLESGAGFALVSFFAEH